MDNKIIIYDFDGTLTPYRIPFYPIMKVALNKVSLMNSVSMLLATYNKSNDFYEWYYKSFFKLLNLSKIPVNYESLVYGAKDIKFNPGVLEYFKSYNDSLNNVKHVILTSGLEEFVKETELYPLVDEVRGTRLNFSDDKIGVESVVNDLKKSLIIKEITGGDCSNVTYVGDGMTDVPAFKYVYNNGGNNVLLDAHRSNEKILNLGIINELFEPDFTSYSRLCKYLKGK